jgi:hypothetical protein
MLYDYDQAAWHTTDTMLKDIPDPAGAGIRGWVVTPVSAGWLVTYLKPNGDGYAAVYSAVWTGTDVTDRKVLKDADTRLSPIQLQLIAARKAVNDSEAKPCANVPFNSVVMPAEDGHSILVYLLTPQTKNDVIPLGGHYRFTIRDGAIVEQRKFTNDCIDLSTGKQDGQAAPVGLVVTHLLDPVPTEIHVFSMFAARIPIYVATTSNRLMWVVEASGGRARIRLLEKIKK